jgi:hypothetical protein
VFNKSDDPNLFGYFSSPSIIRMTKLRRMRWAGHVERMRNAYRILVEKPEGKRPLGRPRCRSVDSIKMDLREIGWDGMDWIGLAQDSYCSMVLARK